MRLAPLTREETTLLKGVGILLIVLHNFLHTIPPIIGENQFSFDAPVTERFVATMRATPAEWPRALLSFLGHYGVQLFIFLSAYGLTRRHAMSKLSYWRFLSGRLDKVYVPFAIVLCLYALLWYPRGLVLGDPEPLDWRAVLLKLTLVSNLVPGQALAPVGPWWFLPFIFQFYLVFPWLRAWQIRFGAPALGVLAAGSLAGEWVAMPFLEGSGLNVNYTVLGHIPVICLGMYAASREDVRLKWPVLPAAALALTLANLGDTIWLVGDLAAALLLLGICVPLITCCPGGMVLRVVRFYGAISLPLFLVNGFLRSPFAGPALAVDLWWFTLLCAAASLLFSTAAAVFVQRSEGVLRRKHRGRIRAAAASDDTARI